MSGPVEIIGVDHIYVSVSDLEVSQRFYDGVMRTLGFRKGDKPIAGEPHAHYFNRAMQLTLRPAHTRAAHDPYAPGLHHLCFQAADRAAVDAAQQRLRDIGVEVSSATEYPQYNDDYYAIFFSDPDGMRLEIVARWDELRVFVNPMAELHQRDRR